VPPPSRRQSLVVVAESLRSDPVAAEAHCGSCCGVCKEETRGGTGGGGGLKKVWNLGRSNGIGRLSGLLMR